MDYEQYRERCQQLAPGFEDGDLAAAEAGWRELIGAAEPQPAGKSGWRRGRR